MVGLGIRVPRTLRVSHHNQTTIHFLVSEAPKLRSFAQMSISVENQGFASPTESNRILADN
jgi:hypothetical protein